MLKKRAFITGILIILISLFSVFLTASATLAKTECNSQTWYMWSDYQLRMDNPTGNPTVVVGSSPVIWQSEQSAQGGVTFGTGDWEGDIGVDGDSPNNHVIMMQIGYVYDSAFYPQGTPEMVAASGKATMTVPGFTVPNGGYLAVSVYDDDATPIDMQVGSGGSFITTPCSDPGFPMPELASSILLAGGAGGLGAFIWWRQRRTRPATA